MESPPLTPESPWHELLSFASHELATPLSVVGGYLDMLLKKRLGPLNEKQEDALKEVEKSYRRLLGLLKDERAIVGFERAETTLRSSSLDLRRILTESITAVPADENHPEEIVLADMHGPTGIVGDEVHLKTAFVSLLWALRRELVDTNRLIVRCREGEFRGTAAHWIAIAGAGHITAATSASEETLTPFNERRGGTGLSVSVARRIIDRHGGAVWSPGQDTKAAAVVVLPRS